MPTTILIANVPQLRPLINPEIVGQNQFNYYMEFKATDIPAGLAVGAAYTLQFGQFYQYNRVNNCLLNVQDPFVDPITTLDNSTLVDVGDASAANGYIAAAQVNKNAAALIKLAWKTGAIVVPKDYTVNSLLSITFTPLAGYSLSALTKGSLIVLFDMFKLAPPVDKDSV